MNDEIHVPTVSIGLAVRNGMPYLIEALDSILAQTYTDFELIISDNASTDETEEVCRRYAAQDSRIRYYRNPTNIGGANNENLTFRLSRGKYFRWAAHDDVLGPTLLERCVDALERHSDAVLAYSWTRIIDESRHELGVIRRDLPYNALSRFRIIVNGGDSCEETYGLIRATALFRTGLQRNYTDSDRTLLAHLSLMGYFVEIPEVLFLRRIHPGKSTVAYGDWRERMIWFEEKSPIAVSLIHWKQWIHYWQILYCERLGGIDRARYFLIVLSWPLQFGRWKALNKDLVRASFALYRWPRRSP